MIEFKISESASDDEIESLEKDVVDKIFQLFKDQFETAFNFIDADLSFPGVKLNDQIVFSGYDLFTGFDRFYKKSKSFSDFIKFFNEYKNNFSKTVQSHLERQGIIHVYYDL